VDRRRLKAYVLRAFGRSTASAKPLAWRPQQTSPQQPPVVSADGSWYASRWWTAVDSSGAVYLSRRAYGGEYLRSTGLVERWTSPETREVLLVDSQGRSAHPSAPGTHWDPELICVDGARLFATDSRRSLVRLVDGQLTSLLSGGAGLADWDRHAGGDPDADPPSYTAIVGDGEGGVYVADPENEGVIHVGPGANRIVSGLQPSAMALDSAGVLLLATRDGITDVTGRRRWSPERPVVVSAMVAHGADLYVASGPSLLRIRSDGAEEVVAHLETRVRGLAVSDDGRLIAVDDNAFSSRRAVSLADLT
jgi:hypothetical protein